MKKRTWEEGFTLLEIILVVVIVAVFTVFATRLSGMSAQAKHFQKTLSRLELVRDKYLGDERIMQSGRRFDFGFFNEVGVASTLDDLSVVWPTPDPYLLAHDDWGERYAVNLGAPSAVISVTSSPNPLPGSVTAARATSGAFAQDLFFSTRISDFNSNSLRIYCKDVNGTLLLGIIPGNNSTITYHIQNITVEIGATSLSVGSGITPDTKGYWTSAVGSYWGPCRILVTPADGTTAGTRNWRAQLSSPSLSVMEFREVLYPKGGFINNQQNVLLIRFPGSVSAPGAPSI